MLLAKAVPRLWPHLAEQINDYIRNIGRLHLQRPNPGAPGSGQLAPVEGDLPQIDIGFVKQELKSSYLVPNPHPGEEFFRRLRQLAKGGTHELVIRRANDLGATWAEILSDRLACLDKNVFDYASSSYGAHGRHGMTGRLVDYSYDDHPPPGESAYHIGIRLRIKAEPPTGEPATPSPPPAARKPDPRDKSKAMIEGLKKALAAGALAEGTRASLKAAHRAMLHALEHTGPPTGMGEDAFAKHCKSWLKEHGIYG
ncbi:MAG TPA: hypothetical protein VNF04_18245 [Stellaceae bacterium]|nr:hypothetical protein [Stellaceae bacterium]